jgi:hypothetical protein
MDTPTDYLALSFEEQDAVLAMISVAAHDCARAYTRYVLRRHDPMLASDIAQDVVLFCLVRLRAGQWSALREARVLPLVQAIVARRGVDLVRQHDRRSKRERIYINALACAESAWMSPDLVLQELVSTAVEIAHFRRSGIAHSDVRVRAYDAERSSEDDVVVERFGRWGVRVAG